MQMSHLQVIREQRIGFGDLGQESQSDQVYIKILASFGEVLRYLKGARLSTFLCVALHESQIVLGASPALTLSSIQVTTGYSRPAIIESLDELVARRLIEELAERGEAGEKQYRVCAYAWFGDKRTPAKGKESLPPSAESKKTLLAKKSFPIVVVDINTTPLLGDHQQQQNLFAATKKLFSQAGVCEPVLSRLSERVELEIAREWCEWLEDAPEEFTNPIGFMVKQLLADPRARPQPRKKRGTWYEKYADLVKR